ncbi:GSCOCG00010745001-RA-CDS [Cotesia congregata]|uniref:aralkylamine N-acetyltransferase n=1 Tax=Cotesia congregata TaxID=51543 RepID=A0A8J2MVE0_COTCN|nr:GSCOCG00010745001-RA-CDS [Cotesia congregata]CAG5097673.1 Similar to AANAT1: Dopamine N-acetyltransferase (Drosophila melanogaster) [Cotesia congregata]
MSSSRLNAVAIPEIRFNEVIEHLRFNFFADEPLNRGVDLCQKGDSHLELENHCLATLKQGYSRMLVTEDGTIAGLALNGVTKKGDREEAVRRLEELDDEKFKIIFGLLYKVSEKVDLFEKYNTEELFECRILSVDEEFRGRGLANVLMADTVDVAKRAGFKVIKADATGIYSQKVFEKHGFKTEAEIFYTDIDDKLRPALPHRSLKLMVLVL